MIRTHHRDDTTNWKYSVKIMKSSLLCNSTAHYSLGSKTALLYSLTENILVATECAGLSQTNAISALP